MMRKDVNKPKGKTSAYAFFVQTCREEHRKKNPEQSVNFAEFSKKCSERWKVRAGWVCVADRCGAGPGAEGALQASVSVCSDFRLCLQVIRSVSRTWPKPTRSATTGR